MTTNELEMMLQQLQRDQADDVRRGICWWIAHELEDRVAIWLTIQRHYEDPALEIMSRFAKIGLTQVALAAYRAGKEN